MSVEPPLLPASRPLRLDVDHSSTGATDEVIVSIDATVEASGSLHAWNHACSAGGDELLQIAVDRPEPDAGDLAPNREEDLLSGRMCRRLPQRPIRRVELTRGSSARASRVGPLPPGARHGTRSAARLARCASLSVADAR